MLKYDVECEKLAKALRRDRAPLPGPLSSFQRQAARRVAAHYGLAVEATPEDGGLALCRTGATRVPASRLQDVPGPPRSAAEDDAALGLGLAAGGAGPEAGPPRVVGVMRRSPSASGASDARAPAAPAAMSVEEREAAYERARERILGAPIADAPAADDAAQQPAAAPPQRESAAQPAASAPAEWEREAAAPPAAERDAAAPGAATPAPSSASAQRRAVMRDREKDLADPDFARPAPPMMPYGGGMVGGPAGPGPYGFGAAPYGDMGAPYGYGGGMGMGGGPDFPPLGAAAGNGGGRWSGGGGYGGGGGGYWPPLGAGGPAQGPAQGRYGYAGGAAPRGAPGAYGGYGAPAGRGGAPAGHERNGW